MSLVFGIARHTSALFLDEEMLTPKFARFSDILLGCHYLEIGSHSVFRGVWTLCSGHSKSISSNHIKSYD